MKHIDIELFRLFSKGDFSRLGRSIEQLEEDLAVKDES